MDRKKYTFNMQLLQNLSDLLNMKQIDIVSVYNGDPATYVYRVRHGTITLCDLISICNHFYIPISAFIIPEGEIINTANLFINEEDWVNIENRFGLFGTQFSNVHTCSHVESAKLCGISQSNYYNLFINDEQRWKKIQIKDFLKIMNNSMTYPGSYIIDKNRPIVLLDFYKEMRMSAEDLSVMLSEHLKKAMKQNEMLVAQMADMQKRMDEMENKMRGMRSDYSMMVAEG